MKISKDYLKSVILEEYKKILSESQEELSEADELEALRKAASAAAAAKRGPSKAPKKPIKEEPTHKKGVKIKLEGNKKPKSKKAVHQAHLDSLEAAQPGDTAFTKDDEKALAGYHKSTKPKSVKEATFDPKRPVGPTAGNIAKYSNVRDPTSSDPLQVRQPIFKNDEKMRPAPSSEVTANRPYASPHEATYDRASMSGKTPYSQHGYSQPDKLVAKSDRDFQRFQQAMEIQAPGTVVNYDPKNKQFTVYYAKQSAGAVQKLINAYKGGGFISAVQTT